MTTPRSYKLEIHIDSQQITKESLEEKANHVLQKYLEENSISLEINTQNSSRHQLIINGDIESVDQCHNKIQQKIINKENLIFYRYTDEAGDEIRYRLYPILADIEQRFRAFINKALAEIWGFDWWEKYTLKDICTDKSNKLHARYKNDQIAPHPLECTLFENLLEIITADIYEFSPNRPLDFNGFIKMLEDWGCETIHDAKIKSSEKTKNISLWNLFSRYFEDQEKWEKLRKNLLDDNNKNSVVEIRNKVMHHRPVRFCLIQKLEEIKQELINVFDSAKTELSEDERIEEQKDTRRISILSDIIECKQLNQVANTILSLQENPFPQDYKMLKGRSGFYQVVRQGEFRVIYKVTEDEVQIFRIGKRNDDELYQNL
jgi:mRNA interferase RelE/StbE